VRTLAHAPVYSRWRGHALFLARPFSRILAECSGTFFFWAAFGWAAHRATDAFFHRPSPTATLQPNRSVGADLNITDPDVVLARGGGKPPKIKGTQVGLSKPEQVETIKEDMRSNNYRFEEDRGRIGGWKDPEGVYHVGEGHHRMAAAQELYKETGDPTAVNKLIRHGLWTETNTPPYRSRPLPGRSSWSRFRNWIGF
jgi:hypothetical protein